MNKHPTFSSVRFLKVGPTLNCILLATQMCPCSSVDFTVAHFAVAYRLVIWQMSALIVSDWIEYVVTSAFICLVGPDSILSPLVIHVALSVRRGPVISNVSRALRKFLVTIMHSK